MQSDTGSASKSTRHTLIKLTSTGVLCKTEKRKYAHIVHIPGVLWSCTVSLGGFKDCMCLFQYTWSHQLLICCCLFLPVTEHLQREVVGQAQASTIVYCMVSSKVYMGFNMLIHCFGPLKAYFCRQHWCNTWFAVLLTHTQRMSLTKLIDKRPFCPTTDFLCWILT